MNKMKFSPLTIILGVVFCLLAAFAVVTAVFLSVVYEPDDYAYAMLESDGIVDVNEVDFGFFFDGPGETEALIFYPGARVEPEAYAPLLHGIASRGVDVFVVRMPLNLAILNVDAAEKVLRDYSYENWYIGGHSMGGAMSSLYVSSHAEDYAGVVLLGAYSSVALDDSLKVVVIYGSEDQVLNRESFESYRSNYPSDYEEYVIEGGNHAQFGSYGEQDGDGEALITNEEQIEQSVDLIVYNCLP